MSARIAAALSVFCFSFYSAGVNAQTPAWNFVSSPDWFNRDVADLSGSTAGIPKAEGWDTDVSGGINGISPQMMLVYDFLVGEMSTYNPQVFAVSGDLINGRWFADSALDMFDSGTRDRATAIDNAAAIYYGWYRHLFGKFGINSVLPVVGDHELGDDAWFAGTEKAQHVQTMRNAFGRNMVDPLSLPAQINGANSRPVGTAFENSSYAYQHLNLLFISIDVFHQSDPTIDVDSLNGTITPEVVGAHLTWLETLLFAADQDSTIDHIIVQGHAPVLSPVRMQQSSGMIFSDRELSPFWNALRQYDHQNGGKVRLYLSGEVHTVTASQDPASDIIQIVHGNPPWAVPGRSEDRTNYLVFTVHPDRLEIESRQALLSNDGSSIFWQPDDPQSEGPSGVQASMQVGTMVIDVTGTTTDVTVSGDLVLIDQVGLVMHFGFDQTTSAGNYSNTGSIGDDYYEGVGAGGVSNVAGQFGTAIDLDGYTGVVRSGRGSIIGGDSRTVSSWIRTTGLDKQTILSYGGNYSGANTRFNLQLKSGQLQLQMASGKTCSPDDSPALSDGAWHHVAIALTDAHNSRCADTLFYIDGVEYSPGANNSTEPFETVPWSDIRIGTDIRESYFFDGSIDDIAIWASPLTSAQMLSIVDAGRHSALGYDAMMMEKLFDLFDAGLGQTSIGEATWRNAAGISGTPGDVVVHDGVLAIALDDAGNGVKSDVSWNEITSHPVSLIDVGAKLKNAGRLIDESGDGTQDLSTSWSNDGKRSTAWFTLDLGSTQLVEEVRIAPRADRLHEIEIYVGDELSGRQVTGVPVSICTPGIKGQQLPTELQSCPVPSTAGRYVTVKLTNKSWFKVYGVEVWGAGGGGNTDPTAAFSATPVAQSLTADFDASESSDRDGIIASYVWDFGDGNVGTGVSPSHTWATDGTYAVTLTVTDDESASDSTSENVTVSTVTSPPSKLPVTVADVGSRSRNAQKLTDELGDGTQDLSTSWSNDGKRSTAWFTLDLGSTQLVEEVRIAPRADRLYEIEIYVGDELSGRQVTGVPVSICTPGIKGQQLPTELQSCPVPSTAGRYVTVKLTNKSWFKVYGVEVWGS